MFAVKFEKPKTYVTSLKGKHLKLVKKIRNGISIGKRGDEIYIARQTALKVLIKYDTSDLLNDILKQKSITLSENNMNNAITNIRKFITYAMERIEKSFKIDYYNNRRKEIKKEHGAITHINKSIEKERKARVKIDKKITEHANMLDLIFKNNNHWNEVIDKFMESLDNIYPTK